MRNSRFFVALVEFLPAWMLVNLNDSLGARDWFVGCNPTARRFARQRYN